MPAVPTLEQRLDAARRPTGRPCVMTQRWEQLLFLHWAIPPDTVQSTLPSGLTVDTYGDLAWLGVVPFFMRGVRPRFCPPVPGISDFLELNLRTYVHDDDGRPGVWFYSLDADQPLAVSIARRLFSLPYVRATMRAERDGDGWIDFQSRRADDEWQRFRYRAADPLGPAAPGTLDHFLVERYLLFSHRPRDGALFVGQVHHVPYPLSAVEVAESNRRLFALNGFGDPGRRADHVVMAAGVSVDIFPLQRISGS